MKGDLVLTINAQPSVDDVMQVAKQLPHYFNAPGLIQMRQDIIAGQTYGAYNHGRLVGFIAFKPLNPQVIELAWIAVASRFQDNGVGTALFHFAAKQFQQNYRLCLVKTLSEIDPDPLYARTRNFYLHLGFIPLITLDPYPEWGPDNPCQLFVKPW